MWMVANYLVSTGSEWKKTCSSGKHSKLIIQTLQLQMEREAFPDSGFSHPVQ